MSAREINKTIMITQLQNKAIGALVMTMSMVTLIGCSEPAAVTDEVNDNFALNAFWIKEPDGSVMLDPQTSGLAVWRDETLLTIADGSADESQILRLIRLDPKQNEIVGPKFKISLAATLHDSCFSEYLTGRPDLEALVVDPTDDSVFYTVTEDASRSELSPNCAKKYHDSGSTPYPTVLVRMELQDDNQVFMTHARPIQFTKAHQVANLPNDGIEGMTFGNGRTLYLALEQDANAQARVFTVQLDETFWDTDEFALVMDPGLEVPRFDSGMHPINALTFVPNAGSDGMLVAAARNDNQLWLIDVAKQRPTQIINLSFNAQIEVAHEGCAGFETINNYSMEGIALVGNTLWIVNDPWKTNYEKNILCEANRANYENMSPLLTQLDVHPDWRK